MHVSSRSLLVAAAIGSGVTAAGCGGSTSVPPPVAVATAPVILVAGSQRVFSGTDSATHVYASPSPGQSNYTSASTFAGTTTISKAAAGAPAAWDVNAVVAYTITQPAKSGAQTLSTDTDTYENQTFAGKTTTIAQIASKSTTKANDLSAAQAGGGPYTLTSVATTTNTVPVTTVFPLQTGLTTTEPLARTVAESATDLNAGGAPPPPSYVYVTGQSATYGNDGSFSYNPQTRSNGEIRVTTENPNGTASEADKNTSYAETIGLPTLSGSSYVIPVAITNTSGVKTSYTAADWYPGGALAPSPLEFKTVAIKGAVSSLPSACSGALAVPNLVEVDTTQTTLNVFGAYSLETQQAFQANGINDCIVRSIVTTNYDIKTGALTETTTESYTQVLKSVTPASSMLRK